MGCKYMHLSTDLYNLLCTGFKICTSKSHNKYNGYAAKSKTISQAMLRFLQLILPFANLTLVTKVLAGLKNGIL